MSVGFALVAVLAASTGSAGAAAPAWSLKLPKNSSATQKNAMDGVSCVGSTFCFAVGGYYTGTNPTVKATQTQKWNGTAWKIVASPNATGPTIMSNFLNGVSCVSKTFCIAAGYYTQTGGGNDQSLIEQWNGHTWTIVTAPDVAGVSNDLNAVSCSSTTFCVAAGDTLDASFVGQTLIEQWDGHAWSVVASPNRSPQSNLLWGVSCATASFCVSTGYYDTDAGEFALIERWNGHKWAATKAPNHTRGASFPTDDLWSVSCVSTTFCMAAGHYLDSAFVKQTLVEEWNGTKWSVLRSPDLAGGEADAWYSGVSCPSISFCMDTTFSSPNTGNEQTVAVEWNGAKLKIVPSADTSATQDNRLQATSCPTAAFCLAVGQYTPSAVSQNLAETWQ